MINTVFEQSSNFAFIQKEVYIKKYCYAGHTQHSVKYLIYGSVLYQYFLCCSLVSIQLSYLQVIRNFLLKHRYASENFASRKYYFILLFAFQFLHYI